MSNFYVRPFDQMAAIELAAIELLARQSGSKRFPGAPESPWQKVAIAKVNGVDTIYSDDRDIRAFAEDLGIKVVSCWELELPMSKTPLLDNPSSPPIDL
jgi:hypothetical protein